MRLTPVNVVGLTAGVASVRAGDINTCAVTTSGGAKCWGFNEDGELGDGTTTMRLTPVDVVGFTSGVASMALGDYHTCAVTTSGGARCWGANFAGELGDGTNVDRLTPVDVKGLSTGTVAIAAGSAHTCAITTAPGIKCWGYNSGGGVGDGTTTNRNTPVDVSGSFYRPECPTLVASDHTSFALSDGYGVGSTAAFSADANYELVGPAALTCRSDLTWSGQPPSAVYLPPLPTVLPGSASVSEGNSGTTPLAVPVSLSSAYNQTVTVQWTTLFATGAPGNQADPATDYIPASGVVTFAPGQTTATAPIQIVGDTLVEPDEYIVVSFHDPTNAVMGGFWGLGFGGILNDDHATVLPGLGSVAAPSSGTADLGVPVTLTNPSTLPITVEWTTLSVPDAPDSSYGPQAPVSDYTPSSGTVTFAPGQTTATVHIPVIADTFVPGEYVVVSFHDPTNAAMGGYWGLGWGIILPTS
jgi:hypothetical protein